MRMILHAIALVVPLVCASSALAQREVAVADFSGPRASLVRREIVSALERAPGLTVVSDGADAVVEGRVARVGRRWRAELRLVSSDGRELATEIVRARRVGALTRVARRWARSSLVELASLAPTEPAPEPDAVLAPPRAASRPRAAAPSAREPARPRLPRPLSVWVGFGVVNRSFTYNDDIFGALVPYHLPAAPVVSGGVEWFPGAHVDLGVLGGLSVRAEGESVVALESVGADGAIFGTDLWSIGVGLRYRLRIDDVELHADGGYRAVAFTIHEPGETQRPPDLPNIEVHAIRAGGGMRWNVGSALFFAASAAYLAPLAAGEITSEGWFPRASVGGVEGSAGLGVRIDDVELRGFFGLRRFFYDMRSEPGDERVAGGAVDEYMSGVLELAWTPSQLAQ